MKPIKILVGFPSYRTVEALAVQTLVHEAYRTAKKRPDVELIFSWRVGFPVAGCVHCYNDTQKYGDARNFFAELALKHDATHIFMMDSDMSYTGEDMLLRLLDADRDIVAPLFMRRTEPFDILAMRTASPGKYASITVKEERSGKIVEIDATGFGAVLIKTALLRDMKFPYFHWETFKGAHLPEDLNFCRKVKRAGGRIFVDTSIHLDHIGEHRYRPEDAIDIQEMREDRYGTGPELNQQDGDLVAQSCESDRGFK